MLFIHRVAAEGVINADRGSVVQSNSRATARHLTLSLESQQDVSSGAPFEAIAGEESGAFESDARVRGLGKLKDSFLINAEVRSGGAFSEVKVLAKTEAHPRQMLCHSMTVAEVQQFEASLFIDRATEQVLLQSAQGGRATPDVSSCWFPER